MKTLSLFLLCLFLFVTGSNYYVYNSNQNISVRSYILIDGYNEEILEGKNYNEVRSVASISKIMTAIIAIESELDLFYSYEIVDRWTNIEGSSLYLQKGEKYRLIDLIYGLLLRSGNDASYAISEIVCDDVDTFVDKMNLKAKNIGMKNTLFSNPCGLDIYDNGNLSTAYDMAILMKYCMNNPLFCEIISTKKHTFGNRVYENKNKLLKTYSYLLGGKTGYTYKAKRTLVTASKKDEQYLIMVTLDCGDDYNFHKSRYEYYFNEYSYVVFLKKGLNHIDEYKIESNMVIGMRINKDLYLNCIKEYFIYPRTKKLKVYLILNETTKIEYKYNINISFR